MRTIIVTDCQTETAFLFNKKKERGGGEEKNKKKKAVKIELAGNQRPQKKAAYRKLPSSVTRWEIFPHVLHGSCRDRMVLHTLKKAHYHRTT